MIMFSYRIPGELKNRLDFLTHQTHRTKSYYLTCALKKFLDDNEDTLLALSRWEDIQSGTSSTVSLEEVEKELHLNDDK